MKSEELESLRIKIDEIDKQMIKLFEKRMESVEAVAKTKKANNISLTDLKREEEVIKKALLNVKDDFKKEAEIFIKNLLTTKCKYIVGDKHIHILTQSLSIVR